MQAAAVVDEGELEQNMKTAEVHHLETGLQRQDEDRLAKVVTVQ